MNLTPQAVDVYKQLMTNPNEHGFFDYKPLAECFEECEEVTPKHILFESYKAYLKRDLPKVIFYIIMDELYGKLIAKDERTGNLGYKLKLVV